MKPTSLLTRLIHSTLMLTASHAKEIGSVDAKFNFWGPDHTIVIEAVDDPKVLGHAHLSQNFPGHPFPDK